MQNICPQDNIYQMDKATTSQLKGIAILSMLWLHLFSSGDLTATLANTVYFYNGAPLATVMKKICSMCVPVYIFLGGYGLAVTHERAVAQGRRMRNWRRVLSLYANLWTVFLFFYPLGLAFNPQLFNTGIYDAALNLTGLKCSMNGAWWFLLPYAILTLLSDRILKLIYSAGVKHEILMLVPVFMLYAGAYVAVDSVNPDHSGTAGLVVINVLRIFMLLFMFMAGVMFARHRLIEKLRSRLTSRYSYGRINVTAACTAAVLLFIKLCIGASSLIHPWFVMILIPLYAVCKRPAWADRMFEYFGRHSTNMWLIHYFFVHYIFGNAIYSLRYPVVIWIVLVAVSLVSSYIVPIRRLVRQERPVISR